MVNVDVIKISEKEGVFTLYTENQILYEFLFGSTYLKLIVGDWF